MVDNLVKYLLTPTGQIAVIIAIAEICKRVELVNAKFIPLVDLFLGLVSGILIYGYVSGYGIAKGHL